MPSSTLDVLLERYEVVSRRNRTAVERFAVVAQAFQQAGVRFLLLKGADVLTRLYGVHGARPLSDVDLLVHGKDLPVIHELLMSLGLAPQIDGNPSYRSADDGLALDLVTGLWYLDESALAQLWARAITRALPSLSITCLSTEDLLIHLTAYAVVHRGHLSPAFAQDVRLLVEKEAPDWDVIVSRAQAYGLAVPLRYGLAYVHARFPGTPIPGHVFPALAPACRRERRLAWLFQRLVTAAPIPEIGHLLVPLTLPNGRTLAWLIRTCFPPSEFLSYRYGTGARPMAWITRSRRLVHLAASGLVLAGRLVRRLLVAGKVV